MTKQGEAPDNAASDHTIEERSRRAATMDASDEIGRHADVKPEDIVVFHQNSDIGDQAKSPQIPHSQFLEYPNIDLEGQL